MVVADAAQAASIIERLIRVADAPSAAHEQDLGTLKIVPGSGPRADRRLPRGAALTPREHEVVRLILRGRSNREIAESLVITERTAETHVRHIREKLGFRSRGQIASWAVEQGIQAGAGTLSSPR